MEELKKKALAQKKKIGKTTYEIVVHFNENAAETMKDKMTRIMLREFRRKSNEKKTILIKKSLTSSSRKDKRTTTGKEARGRSVKLIKNIV